MRSPVLAVVVALGLAAAPRARAECGPPPLAVISTRTVPLHAVVYVFVPSDRAPRFTARQGSTWFLVRSRFLGASEAWRAYELRFEPPRVGDIEVFSGFDRDPWTLTVVPEWRHTEATLRSIERRRFAWSCSHEQGLELTLGGEADAFRLEWIDRDGHAQRAWMPPDLWSAGTLSLMIGHPSCGGFDVPEHAFDQPRMVAIVALYADGTEHVVGAPLIEMPSKPSRYDPFSALFDSYPDTAAVPEPHSDLKSLPPLVPWWGYTLALGAVAGPSVLAIGRRRRRVAGVVA